MSSSWYKKAADYWSQQEASVNGVLGGFGRLSGTDVSASKRFLELAVAKHPVSITRVLDCGGGIGRVSKELLLPKFPKVDLLEPSANLIQQARLELTGKINEFIELPLQEWRGEVSYDLIWAQWVLLYLTDEDLVRFFRFAAVSCLNQGGLLVFKENVAAGDSAVIDEDDNSVTRTPQEYRELIAKSGLEIVIEMKQPMWPSDLFPVIMWAVKTPSASA